jgi:hypothetical protein
VGYAAGDLGLRGEGHGHADPGVVLTRSAVQSALASGLALLLRHQRTRSVTAFRSRPKLLSTPARGLSPVQYVNATGTGSIDRMYARAARIAFDRDGYVSDVNRFEPLPPRTVYQKSPWSFSR